MRLCRAGRCTVSYPRSWLDAYQSTEIIIYRWLGKCTAIFFCFWCIQQLFLYLSYFRARGSDVWRRNMHIMSSNIAGIRTGGLVLTFSTALLFGISGIWGCPSVDKHISRPPVCLTVRCDGWHVHPVSGATAGHHDPETLGIGPCENDGDGARS